MFIKKIENSNTVGFDLKKLKEIKAFKHPNLVKVIGGKNLGDEVTVVEMECCNRKSLGDILQYQTVNLELINLLIIHVLQGLNYLHGKGVVHSDLKVENILVNQNEGDIVFKIGDLDSIKKSPSEFPLFGFYTTEILPPECFEQGIIDYKADIWSFGVMLFLLFTGVYPFGDRRSLTNAWLRGEICKMEFIRDYTTVLAPYNEIISLCLERDKDIRPTASKLLSILEYKQ
jgi:serine/threonine protein kinase